MNKIALTQEKIGDIFAIMQDSIASIDKEFMSLTKNVILGPDGKPSVQHSAMVIERVSELLKVKAESPTILQHLDDLELHKLHDIGASFKISNILAVTVVTPMLRFIPNMDAASAMAIIYDSLMHIADPDSSSLYEKLYKSMNIQNSDEKGHTLLVPEDKKQLIVSTVTSVIVRGLSANKMISLDDDSVSITPLGIAVMQHLSAVDAVFGIIEHSQIQNASEKLPIIK